MRTRFNGSKNVTSCLKSNKAGRASGVKFKKLSPKKEDDEINKEPLSIYNF
jgi:hypothetical protein